MAQTRPKYSLVERLNLEDLYNAFLGLDQRNQVLILCATAFVLLMLIVMPISCASSKLNKLESDYSKVDKEEQTFSNKVATYKASKDALLAAQNKIRQSGGNSSLNTIIAALATDAGIGQNIDRLKPITSPSNSDYFDEEGVDGSISKASLDQVVNFLYHLENYPGLPIKIKKITLKSGYNRRDEFTLLFQVSTMKLKGKGEENE